MIKYINRAAGWFLAATFASAVGVVLHHPYTAHTIVADVVFAIVATVVEAWWTSKDGPSSPTPTMRFV